MTVAALIIAAALAAVAVLFVARPFLRSAGTREEPIRDSDAAELRRLELLEERDRALASLKELEFDHRTGKISDDDYRELVGPLRREAAAAIKALDPAAPPARSGEVEGSAAAADRDPERI